jgi:hypothetical protein
MPSGPCTPPGVTNPRALASFDIRFGTASAEASVPLPSHATNHDETHYPDKSGSYTKCVLQDTYGVVNPAAFAAFRAALGPADGSWVGTADFESVPLGGTRPLNGPLGAFAYTLVGTDSQQFGHYNAAGALICPPPPKVRSEEYAAELVELYWASLLRDVAFTDYASNATAIAAAGELSGLAAYKGPRDAAGEVTPDLLFRGGGAFAAKDAAPVPWFAGETIGPYVSQFCIVPTVLGVQPIDQRWITAAPGVDFMTDLDFWQKVQNGISTGVTLALSTTDLRYAHNGRSLSTFTHQDELYQAYLTAYLVMKTLNVPANKHNPYATFTHQQPFGTFGGPDIAATLAAVARTALNAVWYQKWIVHLRHRPESGGGLVELFNRGLAGTVDAKLSPTVLNSEALAASFSKYGSHLLSQAFPEGSPAHPAYPTGHGTVAGACITVLKFFYEGTTPIPSPMVPSSDGLSLLPYAYTPADDGVMTVNGELHKLAHNITFGHGIHGGIHWRSDSDFSIRLGEAVALSYLRDQAFTYKESVSVPITLVDGSVVKITN